MEAWFHLGVQLQACGFYSVWTSLPAGFLFGAPESSASKWLLAWVGGFDFSPTAASDEVSAQIGSGVVRGGSEVRFRRVPPARVPQGLRCGLARSRVPRGFREGWCCWGSMLPELTRRPTTCEPAFWL